MMFVGSEFNFRRILAVDKTNIILPFIIILIPFLLGAVTYLLLLKLGLIDSFGISHKFLIAIFIGIAVSMSAFSMLVMFINNTKLKFSRIGKVAIFCATFEDAVFWILFAIVLACFQENGYMHATPIIYLGLYILFIIYIMPFIINKIINKIHTSLSMLGLIFGGCLLSANLADLVNLHPMFGGFIFGLSLPRNNAIIKQLREHLLEFVIIILLPVYFVKTGIEASTSLSFDQSTMMVCIIFILISFLGKYGSAFIVGKTWHFSNKEIVLLGSLLSIRGTIEIALLNVGMEIGLLESKTYSALVIMSLITTWFATSLTLYLDKKCVNT